MVPGGPWPAAGRVPEEHPGIFQRAASDKQQATSGKRQAIATIGKYNKK